MPSSSYEEVDARFNYWGETTTAEMNEGGNPKNIASIYDEYDDATKGFVNYGNYLSASGEQPSVTNGTGSVLLQMLQE